MTFADLKRWAASLLSLAVVNLEPEQSCFFPSMGPRLCWACKLFLSILVKMFALPCSLAQGNRSSEPSQRFFGNTTCNVSQLLYPVQYNMQQWLKILRGKKDWLPKNITREMSASSKGCVLQTPSLSNLSHDNCTNMSGAELLCQLHSIILTNSACQECSCVTYFSFHKRFFQIQQKLCLCCQLSLIGSFLIFLFYSGSKKYTDDGMGWVVSHLFCLLFVWNGIEESFVVAELAVESETLGSLYFLTNQLKIEHSLNHGASYVFSIFEGQPEWRPSQILNYPAMWKHKGWK